MAVLAFEFSGNVADSPDPRPLALGDFEALFVLRELGGDQRIAVIILSLE